MLGVERRSVNRGLGMPPDADWPRGEEMGFREDYEGLLAEIADEADRMALRYFRTPQLRVDRKGDGTLVTQVDRGIEEMARAAVAASEAPLDVLGEEMGGAGGDAVGLALPALGNRRVERPG